MLETATSDKDVYYQIDNTSTDPSGGYTTFTSGDLTVGEPKAFELESMLAAVSYATAGASLCCGCSSCQERCTKAFIMCDGSDSN